MIKRWKVQWRILLPYLLWAISPSTVFYSATKLAYKAQLIHICLTVLGLKEFQNTEAMVTFDQAAPGVVENAGWSEGFSIFPAKLKIKLLLINSRFVVNFQWKTLSTNLAFCSFSVALKCIWFRFDTEITIKYWNWLDLKP